MKVFSWNGFNPSHRTSSSPPHSEKQIGGDWWLEKVGGGRFQPWFFFQIMNFGFSTLWLLFVAHTKTVNLIGLPYFWKLHPMPPPQKKKTRFIIWSLIHFFRKWSSSKRSINIPYYKNMGEYVCKKIKLIYFCQKVLETCIVSSH